MGTTAARLPIPRRIGIERTRLLLAAVIAVVGFSMMAAALVVAKVVLPLTESVAKRVGELSALASTGGDSDARSKIYSADGRLIAILHGEENREPVALSRVPMFVRQAVIAIEDRRFYSHDGVDVAALGRAFIVNAAGLQIEQGGGTITMQLARSAYLHDHSKTIGRKLEEMVVARRLEARLSKDQILGEYLNSVYFGRGAYGIQAASEAFFGIPVTKLTLGQGSFLAGLIRSPERLDPGKHLDDALARRGQVLSAMQAQGYITAAQAAKAVREKIRLATFTPSNGIVMVADAGATFVDYIKQQLLHDPRLGDTAEERTARVFGGGLRITTTLDLRAQRAAEHSIASVLDLKGDPSGALASVEPGTGAIRAMAGAITAQGFNLAAQGRRQPGSAFKPFTLVAALEQGISLYKGYSARVPRIIHLDSGTDWVVHNYEGSPGGFLNVIEATRYSVNTVYAQIVMDAGPSNVVDVAHRMGITSSLDAYPSIALGALTIGVSPLEMASAYATLADGGMAYKPYAIAKVTDRAGETLFETKPDGKRALEPEIADKARAVLEQVIARGTGKRAQRLGRPAAGKTGTTDNYADSWFAGFTPQLSTAVWLGYPGRLIGMNNIHGLAHIYGGSLPCEIWTRFMISALAGKPVIGFSEVSLRGGDAGSGGSGGTTGTEPQPVPQPTTRRCWGHHHHCKP
jgi:penicillin-binding protein 1A